MASGRLPERVSATPSAINWPSISVAHGSWIASLSILSRSDMEELLNVEEAAKFLRVSPRTVYEMTSAGTHYAVDPGVDAGTCVAASTPGRCFSPRRYGTHCDWPVYLPAFVLNSCSA